MKEFIFSLKLKTMYPRNYIPMYKQIPHNPRKFASMNLNDYTVLIVMLQSTMGYSDLFSETWKAFTDYPIIRLHEYDKKRVSLVLLYVIGVI